MIASRTRGVNSASGIPSTLATSFVALAERADALPCARLTLLFEVTAPTPVVDFGVIFMERLNALACLFWLIPTLYCAAS
jgi:hypothetical protein